MALGLSRDTCLEVCGLSKHAFYYCSTGSKPGKTASQTSMQWKDGSWLEVANARVIEEMHQINEQAGKMQGYHRMCAELQLQGFKINRKKVYRLMKEAKLLRKVVKPKGRKYVRYRIVLPSEPLTLLEMDIKQVWIAGQSRPAFILTILDVFTRSALYWQVGYRMTNEQVRAAWECLIEHVLQPLKRPDAHMHIEVRCDNGPQFVAKALQLFLCENFLQQTFTHPYTPQENGHIESFHAILGDSLEERYFEDLSDLENFLEGFYKRYNYERVHSGILYLPPVTFWHQWTLGHIECQVIDEPKRKARFSLKIPRWQIRKIQPQPAGNGSQREVLSLDFLGLDAPENPITTIKQQSDGAVLNAQPAV